MRNATKVGPARIANALVAGGPLLFCLLILPCTVFAGADTADQKKEKDAQSLFAAGQKMFRNSDYSSAVEAFVKYTAIVPDDPRGPWMELKARCMKFRADSNADEISGKPQKLSDAAYAKAMLLAESAIRSAEEKIANDEDVGFYQFIQADTYGLRGIFRMANGNIGSALADAELMKELAKKSSYQDAKYILGLAEYELSLKGWLYRLGGIFKGFSSNRNDALRLIHEAEANNTGPFSDDIRLLMLQILTDTKRLKDKERLYAEEAFGIKTRDLYGRLKAVYPQNEIVLRYEKSKVK
ncbi:MAG: hypothetical protein Q8P49_00180 [Candidatus Liptonbacteria bacterium]|nr:hypothetical protein [Candidatus Liptonbacteria bacterium]